MPTARASPDLPLLQTHEYAAEAVRLGTPRRSKMGRRRAAVLAGVHVLIFLHILHWQVSGRTLSPMEPNQTIETLATGAINAGAMMFGLTIFSTLLVGRFFCGWACHVVALQDLCAWLLTRVGLRPRVLRSRWLVFVPLGAAIWMFVLPTVVRLVGGGSLPAFGLKVMTSGFWDSFPSYGIALLTFAVCGFAIVYLLGSKGFCTYACPYGGFYGLADKFAMGRIRVDDSCIACGHCTAVCTSNVDVSREVALHGMVVNPGCMKCMDCVSTCPEHALYFGFGRPALLGRLRARLARRPLPGWRPHFTRREEVALVIVFVAAFPTFFKLYAMVPRLLALAFASISAFVALFWWRMLRDSAVTFQGRSLKAAGRWRSAGVAFFVPATIWLALALHSAWIQGTLYRASSLLDQLESIETAAWLQDHSVLSALDAEQRDALATSERLLLRARAVGLVGDPHLMRELAIVALFRGDPIRAEAEFRSAVAKKPRSAALRRDLAGVLSLRGNWQETIHELEQAVELAPDEAVYHLGLARALQNAGDLRGVAAALHGLFQHHPQNVPGQVELAVLAARLGNRAGARATLQRIVELHPESARAHYELGQLLVSDGARTGEALDHLNAASDLAQGRRDAEAELVWRAIRRARLADPQLSRAAPDVLSGSEPEP